jgi:hypothetical protein
MKLDEHVFDVPGGARWVDGVNGSTWDPIKSEGLLLNRLHDHVEDFLAGGYIADYDGFVIGELDKRGNDRKNKADFDEYVYMRLERVPGTPGLDHNFDMSTLLSLYGKIYPRLERTGSRPDKLIKDANGISKAQWVYDLEATGRALAEVLENYAAAIADGILSFEQEREKKIEWTASRILAEIMRESLDSDIGVDPFVIARIDDALFRFSNAAMRDEGLFAVDDDSEEAEELVRPRM